MEFVEIRCDSRLEEEVGGKGVESGKVGKIVHSRADKEMFDGETDWLLLQMLLERLRHTNQR